MIAQTENLFSPLEGQIAQGCWLGYGSVLFLEFGEPQPPRDHETHPSGELGLHCEWVEWRIEQRDRVVAGSEDDRLTMESGIKQIDGKTFKSAAISWPSGDSILTFSDDLVLRTFVITSEEDARWIFRDRESRYFRLGPDGAYAEDEVAGARRSGVAMMQGDADALQQLSKLVWNSEIWRVAVNVQHRFEDGYEPSDMDSLRLDLRQLLPNPESRIKHRQVGSVWVDTSVCGLRLERTGEVVVASGDSSEKVLTQFRGLVGRTLVRVDIVTPAGDADFVLGDGSVLGCFPARSHFGESWRILSAENDRSPLGPASTSR